MFALNSTFNHQATMLSLTALLATLAFLGNVFSISLFYGIDLIFGSVFVFIAVAYLGGLPTFLVAIAGGLYTWMLWDHPYAMVVVATEAVFVYWLNRRMGKSLLMADGLFWLFIGVPMVILFYSQALALSLEASALVALKQCINGIFNVVIAGLILFLLDMVRNRMSPVYLTSGQIKNILFQAMLALTIVAGTVPIILYGSMERQNRENLLVAELSGYLNHLVANFSVSRESESDFLADFDLHRRPDSSLAYGIRDGSGKVLASKGDPWIRSGNTKPGSTLTEGLRLIEPDRNLSTMQSWRQGRYEMTQTVGGTSPRTFIVQTPALPVVKEMEEKSLLFLMLLGGLLLFSILVSRVLSKLLTIPLWRFSTALNSATNGIIITGIEGQVEWINQGFTNISGYRLADLRGKKPGHVLQGLGTDPQTVARIRQAWGERRGFDEEIFNYGKKGQGYWILINCEPLYREDGVMQGFIAVQTNITEQKDTADLERFGSKALEKIAGNDVLQDIYINVIASIEAVIAARCIIEFNAPEAEADPYVPRACFINTDRGSIRAFSHCQSTPVPIIDSEKRSLGVLKVFWAEEPKLSAKNIEIFEKASRLIAIATERFSADRKLHESASVFRYANEGIFITDVDFSILDVNAAFTKITGYGKGEAVGRSPKQLYSSGQNDVLTPQALQTLDEVGEWQNDLHITNKHGNSVIFHQNISAIRGKRGEIRRYVFLLSDITEVKEYQKQLESMAKYDALTELPNRVLLGDRLTQAMRLAERNNERLALLFIDLDGFKQVNDTLGHGVGDDLLKKITWRVSQELRGSDTFSRLGGDEFVVVLPELGKTERAESVVSRILLAIAEKVTLAEQELFITASIGLTFYPQSETLDADQLLRQADQAMYVAKQKGRNRFQYFDTENDKAVRSLHEDQTRIQLGLNRNEFVLFYQPQVNLKSGEVVGAEALIRWQHPERGLVAPNDFLPLIEHHPLSVDLGEWVLNSALAQMTEWRRQGVLIPVSVNINSLHLRQLDFVERLEAILSLYPSIPNGQIELEIVETSSLENLEIVSETIDACRQLGVICSLDDFGTGYSSLSYLRRLPVEKLKIDMSFVRDMLVDPNDFAIVQGILGLAKSFGLAVIAEGVETPEHSEQLVKLGCDFGQGYGIARPMPAAAMPDWIRQWNESSSASMRAENDKI
jgi:diguanylate cyclase (GGDEF)-like protein/PAS domain S-box-containing protein